MPRPGKMVYIITYDIVNDNRRNRLARLLGNYGVRVQYSVFECEMSPPTLADLREALVDCYDPQTDRVRIYPLCATCMQNLIRLGTRELVEWEEPCLIL